MAENLGLAFMAATLIAAIIQIIIAWPRKGRGKRRK